MRFQMGFVFLSSEWAKNDISCISIREVQHRKKFAREITTVTEFKLTSDSSDGTHLSHMLQTAECNMSKKMTCTKESAIGNLFSSSLERVKLRR